MGGRPRLMWVVRAVALAWLAGAAACSHMPWHHRPPPAPAPVHELDISSTGANTAAAFPQYWKRNTLLVDLSAARGSGSIVLRPASGAAWPVRLAFRVTPGAIGALEVSGAQHTRLPINPSGSRPVDLELDPGIYTPQSEEMTVSWGPEIAPAP
ncbi:MAG: hypothetical protein WA747_07225 [Steroidobacteraceae bacterium]